MLTSIMAGREPGFWLRRAARALQDNITRSGPAAGASYSLIGAIMVLGGLGYLIDHWRGTGARWTIAGLVLGIVVGFYELVKVTWRR
jgi:F0F1-type ATP synthase assembly protein I